MIAQGMSLEVEVRSPLLTGSPLCLPSVTVAFQGCGEGVILALVLAGVWQMNSGCSGQEQVNPQAFWVRGSYAMPVFSHCLSILSLVSAIPLSLR